MKQRAHTSNIKDRLCYFICQLPKHMVLQVNDRNSSVKNRELVYCPVLVNERCDTIDIITEGVKGGGPS